MKIRIFELLVVAIFIVSTFAPFGANILTNSEKSSESQSPQLKITPVSITSSSNTQSQSATNSGKTQQAKSYSYSTVVQKSYTNNVQQPIQTENTNINSQSKIGSVNTQRTSLLAESLNTSLGTNSSLNSPKASSLNTQQVSSLATTSTPVFDTSQDIVAMYAYYDSGNKFNQYGYTDGALPNFFDPVGETDKPSSAYNIAGYQGNSNTFSTVFGPNSLPKNQLIQGYMFYIARASSQSISNMEVQYSVGTGSTQKLEVDCNKFQSNSVKGEIEITAQGNVRAQCVTSSGSFSSSGWSSWVSITTASPPSWYVQQPTTTMPNFYISHASSTTVKIVDIEFSYQSFTGQLAWCGTAGFNIAQNAAPSWSFSLSESGLVSYSTYYQVAGPGDSLTFKSGVSTSFDYTNYYSITDGTGTTSGFICSDSSNDAVLLFGSSITLYSDQSCSSSYSFTYTFPTSPSNAISYFGVEFLDSSGNIGTYQYYSYSSGNYYFFYDNSIQSAVTGTALSAYTSSGNTYSKSSSTYVQEGKLTVSDYSGVSLVQYCKNPSTGCTPDTSATYSSGAYYTNQISSSDGANYINWYVKDGNGNSNTYSQTIITDNSAPDYASGYSAPVLTGTKLISTSQWYTSSVSVSAAFTDSGSGISSITYTVGTTTTTCTSNPCGPTLTSDSGPSGTTVTYTITDNVGNSQTKSTTVYIDTTAPIFSNGYPTISSGTLGSNGWYTSDVQWTASGTDAGSGIAKISYQISTTGTFGSSWSDVSCSSSCSSFSATSASISDGSSYYIEWQITDNAGQVSSVYTSSKFKIDTIAPTIDSLTPSTSSTAPTNITSANGQFSIAISESGSGNCVYSYNWDSGTVYSGSISSFSISNIPTSDGLHILSLTVSDSAGNSVSATYNYIIDNTAPTAVLYSLTNSSIYKSGTSIELTFDDTGSGTFSTYSGLAYYGYFWTVTSSDTPVYTINYFSANTNTKLTTVGTGGLPDPIPPGDGYHFLFIEVVDNVGNVYKCMFTFIADNTAPVLSSITPNPTVTNSTTGILNKYQKSGTAITITLSDGSGIGGIQYKYAWDSDGLPASYTSYGSSLIVFIPANDGDHVLHIYVIDALGNSASLSPITFTADNTAPFVSSISPDPTQSRIINSNQISNVYELSNTQISLTLTDNGAQGIQYKFKWDSGNYSTLTIGTSITAFLPSGNGNHTLSAYITDALGNLFIYNVTYIVDNSAPTITSFSLANNSFVQSNYQIIVSFSDNGGIGLQTYLTQWDYNTIIGAWTGGSTNNLVGISGGIITVPASTDQVIYLYIQVTDLLGNYRTIMYSFKIDNSAPVVQSITPAPATFKSGTTITITLSDGFGIGGVQYQYKWDSNSYTTLVSGASITTSIPIGDGQHVLTIIVKDALGNTNSVSPYTYTYTTDDTAPTSVISLTNNTFYKSSTAITITLSDGSGIGGVQYQYKWDNNSYTVLITGTSMSTSIPSGDGEHILTLFTKDALGNNVTYNYVFFADNTAPKINNISFTGNRGLNGWYNTTGYAEISVTDGNGSGVASVSYCYGSYVSCVSWNVISLPNLQGYYLSPLLYDGVNTISWKVVDNLGFTTYYDSQVIKIDTISPTVGTLNFPNGWQTTGLTYSFSFTVTDYSSGGTGLGSLVNQTKFAISIDNGITWIPITSGFSFSNNVFTYRYTFPSDGIYSVLFKGEDNAGNKFTTPVQTVEISNSPPTMNAITVLPNWYTTRQIVVVVQFNKSLAPIDTSSTSSAFSYSTDGGLTWNPISNPSISNNQLTFSYQFASDGTFSLQIRVKDQALLVSNPAIFSPINIDTIAPTYTVTNIPSSGSWQTTSNYTFIVSAFDSGSGLNVTSFTYQIDSSNITTISSSNYNSATQKLIFTVPLTDGVHTIVLKARDLAKNSIIVMVTINVDTTKPVVSAVNSPAMNGWVNSTNYNFQLRVIDLTSGVNTNSFTYILDGGTIVNIYSSNFNSAQNLLTVPITGLSDGSHSIIINSYDNAGNVAVYKVSFTVDATAPTMLSTYPVPGINSYGQSGTIIAFAFTDGNGYGSITYKYQWDSGAWSSWNATQIITRPTGDGQHILNIIVQDGLGNINSNYQNMIFFTDDTAPTVTIKNPTNNSYIGGTSFTLSANYSTDVQSISWIIYNSTYSYNIVNPSGFDTSILADGEYSLKATVVDRANNIGSSIITVDVRNAAPYAVFVYPANQDALISGTINIQVNITGYYSTITYQYYEDINNDGIMNDGYPAVTINTGTSNTVQPFNTKIDNNLTYSGAIFLIVTVYNSLSKANTVTILHVMVDNTPPTISVLNYSNFNTVPGYFYFSFSTSSDTKSILVEDLPDYNGNGIPDDGYYSSLAYTTNVTFPLYVNVTSIGQYLTFFKITATDYAGNQKVITIQLYIDLTPPVITWTPKSTTISGSYSIIANTDDQLLSMTYQYQMSGENTWTTFNNPLNTTALGTGVFNVSIKVIAINLAGLESSKTIEFTVANTALSVASVDIPSSINANSSALVKVNLQIVGLNASQLTVYLQKYNDIGYDNYVYLQYDPTVGVWYGYITTTYQNYGKTFTFRVVAFSSLLSTTSSDYNVTIDDTQGPSIISENLPNATSQNSNNLVFVLKLYDGASGVDTESVNIHIKINSNSWSTNQLIYNSNTNEYQYILSPNSQWSVNGYVIQYYFTFSDLDQNTVETTAQTTQIVDTLPPTVAFNQLPSQVDLNNYQVNFTVADPSGISSLQVMYSSDNGTHWTSSTITLSGDSNAPSLTGTWIIPAQNWESVQFYIKTSDKLGNVGYYSTIGESNAEQTAKQHSFKLLNLNNNSGFTGASVRTDVPTNNSGSDMIINGLIIIASVGAVSGVGWKFGKKMKHKNTPPKTTEKVNASVTTTKTTTLNYFSKTSGKDRPAMVDEKELFD